MANCRPMQARWPLPNGLKACGDIFASRSGAKLSGLNTSACGPHTDLSRCSIAVSTVTKVRLRSLYFPPIVSF